MKISINNENPKYFSTTQEGQKEVWNFDMTEKADLLNTYGKDITSGILKAGHLNM